MVHNSTNWAPMVEAKNSGEVFEMDEDTWFYWLEVLPPVYMNRDQIVKGKKRRCEFGFAEGVEQITDFWRDGGKFYGCRSKRWHHGG